MREVETSFMSVTSPTPPSSPGHDDIVHVVGMNDTLARCVRVLPLSALQRHTSMRDERVVCCPCERAAALDLHNSYADCITLNQTSSCSCQISPQGYIHEWTDSLSRFLSR